MVTVVGLNHQGGKHVKEQSLPSANPAETDWRHRVRSCAPGSFGHRRPTSHRPDPRGTGAAGRPTLAMSHSRPTLVSTVSLSEATFRVALFSTSSKRAALFVSQKPPLDFSYGAAAGFLLLSVLRFLFFLRFKLLLLAHCWLLLLRWCCWWWRQRSRHCSPLPLILLFRTAHSRARSPYRVCGIRFGCIFTSLEKYNILCVFHHGPRLALLYGYTTASIPLTLASSLWVVCYAALAATFRNKNCVDHTTDRSVLPR